MLANFGTFAMVEANLQQLHLQQRNQLAGYIINQLVKDVDYSCNSLDDINCKNFSPDVESNNYDTNGNSADNNANVYSRFNKKSFIRPSGCNCRSAVS